MAAQPVPGSLCLYACVPAALVPCILFKFCYYAIVLAGVLVVHCSHACHFTYTMLYAIMYMLFCPILPSAFFFLFSGHFSVFEHLCMPLLYFVHVFIHVPPQHNNARHIIPWHGCSVFMYIYHTCICCLLLHTLNAHRSETEDGTGGWSRVETGGVGGQGWVGGTFPALAASSSLNSLLCATCILPLCLSTLLSLYTSPLTSLPYLLSLLLSLHLFLLLFARALPFLFIVC